MNPTAHIRAARLSVMPSGPAPTRPAGRGSVAVAAGFTETLTFRVAVPLPFALKLTDAGVNVQFTPAGALPHANVTDPDTVFVDCNDTAKLAAPPTLIVADTGDTVALTWAKLNGGGVVIPLESPLIRTSPPLPALPNHTTYTLPLASAAICPVFAAAVGALSIVNFWKVAPSVERARIMSYAPLGFAALACCQMTSIAPLDSVTICGNPVGSPSTGGLVRIGGLLQGRACPRKSSLGPAD